MNNQIECGKVEFETVDNAKMTERQKNLVIKIIKGHVEDKNYWFAWAKVHVGRYFTAVSFYYYPNDARQNPYLTVNKNFWIGKKGAFQKATVKYGIGKEHNYKKIPQYLFKASD